LTSHSDALHTAAKHYADAEANTHALFKANPA
jgi:hypothetical protein